VRRAVARVDVGAIRRNCERLKGTVGAGTRLCAVVKADGYGHGAAAAGRAARAGGAEWLGVATAEEAAALRAAGLPGPVLVMGALSEEELAIAAAARADVVAWREGFVADAARAAGAAGSEPLGVHVKLDTGMGRLGTRDPEEALAVAHAAAADARLRVAGAMTHFATADEDDPAFLREQLRAFEPWAAAMRDAFPGALVHAANSAAALREPAARFDLVRCGIAVYGMDPFGRDAGEHGLEPALELRSYVAEVKRAGPGQSAGYGRRFVAAAPTWIATLPIGYADGVRRGLTNDLDVTIAGRAYPLVGTVSMDNVTVDLGPDDSARALRGEPAVLLGPGMPAEAWARRLQTINYEVTCGIGARVPREHVGA